MPQIFLWLLSLLVAKNCHKISSFGTGKKTNWQKLKKGWKTYFQVQLWPKLGPPNFFLWVLPLLDVTHYCKLSLYAISRKTDEPNLRFGEKPNFRPDFGLLGPYLGRKIFSWILPLLDIRHYCKLSLHAISRKTDEPNLRFGEKPNFRPDFGLLGPYLDRKKFFMGFTSTTC